MLELLTMSILGVAYVSSCIQERKEELEKQHKEKIRELKIDVFCYAVRHKMLYNDVVKLIEENKLSFEDLNKETQKHE